MDGVTISMIGMFIVGCLLLYFTSRFRRAFAEEDDPVTDDIGFNHARTIIEEDFEEEAQEATEALEQEDPEDALADLVNRSRRRK